MSMHLAAELKVASSSHHVVGFFFFISPKEAVRVYSGNLGFFLLLGFSHSNLKAFA